VEGRNGWILKRLPVAVVAAALLGVPSGAGAATATLGAVAPANTPANCSACTDFQLTTHPSSPSYIVPAGSWTITSWSARGRPAGGGNGTGRLRVFRPVGTNLYRVVAESTDATIAENAAPSIPTSLPVQQGDLIGLRTGSVSPVVDYYASPLPGDAIAGALGDPAPGQTVGPGGDYPSFTDSPFRINVSAVLTSATSATTCKGRPVTILGTPGGDELIGSSGPDVIAAKGANDKVRGRGGNDVICGGGGEDTLKGGPGNDELYGQGAKDKLVGGGATDKCVGGKASDKAKGCETAKSI